MSFENIETISITRITKICTITINIILWVELTNQKKKFKILLLKTKK